MDKLKKMAVFARVVELGSFAAAADDLSLSPAIVGRHVADLEGLLGMRLINRTTRAMEVTEAGQRYYQGSKAMLEQMASLEQDIKVQSGGEPSGAIRLAAPEGLGRLLLDAIEGFQAQYPRVLFDLVCDNQQTDFVSADVDLAIRLAITLEDSSLIVTKLTQTRLALFASADYIAKSGCPETMHDLENHACLAFGGSRFGDSWPVVSGKGLHKLRLPWRLVVNQTQIYREALVQGMGIGLLPEIMAQDLLDSGQLCHIQLTSEFPRVGVFSVYPSRAFQPRRVNLFLQHLRGHTGIKAQVQGITMKT